MGRRKWSRRLEKAIKCLRALLHFDHLYIGGGNARKLRYHPDPDTTIIANEAGIRGGIALWRADERADRGARTAKRPARRSGGPGRTVKRSGYLRAVS